MNAVILIAFLAIAGAQAGFLGAPAVYTAPFYAAPVLKTHVPLAYAAPLAYAHPVVKTFAPAIHPAGFYSHHYAAPNALGQQVFFK